LEKSLQSLGIPPIEFVNYMLRTAPFLVRPVSRFRRMGALSE
jgi:hypothetical protein